MQPAPNALTGTLAFFDRLGIFTVLLPFLLVFTVVYAVLEKTKLYGMDTIKAGDKSYEMSRKNLNAITAFIVAFLVVASSRLVAIINETLAHTVLLLLLIICFMMLVGAFHSGNEEFSLDRKEYKGWKTFFMILSFIGIVFIFLNATGILSQAYYYIVANWSSTAVSSIGLIVVIVASILFITNTKDVKKEE